MSTRRRLLAFLLAPCGVMATAAIPAADLRVAAAASLTDAFDELAPLFEAEHPGTRLRLHFGASGALLQQLPRAPADVFASADEETLDLAQHQRLLAAGQRANFATNRLVVVVPQSAPRLPGRLADLADPGYRRLAMGRPATVPGGRYTQVALERAGLWQAIEPRVVGADSVRQALEQVGGGRADAGFVYATDAAQAPDKVKVAFAVPSARPIVYAAAPLAASPQAALASRFVQWLLSPRAQTVLARHGFGRP